MPEKVATLTKSTLVPIGLVLALISAVWALAGERGEMRQRVAVVEQRQADYEETQKRIAGELGLIRETLGRMEERTKDKRP